MGKYKALCMLTKDFTTPPDTVMKVAGVSRMDLLELVEETGGKHYRVLGFKPPSELMSSVRKFYEALEINFLGIAQYDEDGRPIGCIPQGAAAEMSLNVPCYGKYWYAWDPKILDLLTICT